MKKNPFKFGTIVDEPYFTNRIEEISKVKSVLNSNNHLIIISPRRFGKTSLIKKVINSINRPSVYLDLQLIIDTEDLAAQLLKRIYRVFPFEKLKQQIKNFRVIPNISLNPINNEIDISFRQVSSNFVLMEDVLNLIEKLSRKSERIAVVLDEFQEIKNIDKNLDKHLRSVIQHHQRINYVFLGSQEHLMRDIFEKKNSSFYHFGSLLPLGKIPYREFMKFLTDNFSTVTKDAEKISGEILEITHSHPFYTQQLAFEIYEYFIKKDYSPGIVEKGVEEIIRIHDMDFERLWNTLNRTQMKILIGMTQTDISPLSAEFLRITEEIPVSTIFSSLKKLMQKGIVIKTGKRYEIDDPFFFRWIKERRLN